MIQNKYYPDYVSLPGETLKETLETIGMSQKELAQRMGRPDKTISEIITGKATITSETALQLEHVLKVPASFWNTRAQHYQEYLARIREQTELNKQENWFKKIPLRAMLQKGWIQPAPTVMQSHQEILNFFRVASPQQWENWWQKQNFSLACRKSRKFKSDRFAIATWLRKGELDAQDIKCAPYDKKRFQTALQTARKLIKIADPQRFVPQLQKICSEAGVAVIFVPELPRTCVSGATRWISQNKALIQLSLRYKTNDTLWFTFFHEAGHILFHHKRSFFIEGLAKDRYEKEADTFARDFLIPPKKWKIFRQAGDFHRTTILTFASDVQVAPAIITGRLKHEKLLPWTAYSDMTIRYGWQ